MDCKKMVSVGFLLILIFAIGIYALYLLTQGKSTENYIFFGFVSLTFIVIYSISILNYKITGSSIGIEAEQVRQEIKSSREEIEKVANTLIKVSYVLADGSSRLGGVPKEHLKVIEEYQNSISEFLAKNIDDEIRNTISNINESIKKRIEEERSKKA